MILELKGKCGKYYYSSYSLRMKIQFHRWQVRWQKTPVRIRIRMDVRFFYI